MGNVARSLHCCIEACLEPSFGGSRRVQDDRQELDGHLDELLRTVRNIALEREGIARMEDIGLLAVPVFNHTFQHMNELGAGMLEDRKSFSFVIHRDEKRFED